jgi:hypothetical protein
MDDYLGRLARRQVQAAVAGLTPRLPPRFVATQGLDAADLPAPPAATAAREPADDRIAPAGPAEPPDRQAPFSARAGPTGDMALERIARIERPDHAAPAVEAERGTPGAAVIRGAMAGPQVQPSLASPGLPAGIQRSSPTAGSPRRAVLHPLTARPTEHGGQSAPELPLPAERLVRETRTLPAVVPRRDERLGPSVVNLSIDRVEVRVVSTPTAAAPAPVARARRKPALSLEDYLSRRHGAARR